MDISRAENKLPVGGWFFQGPEQGVKGLGGEHMNFINDEDFIRSIHGRVFYDFPQIPDFLDSPVGGTINFQYVQIPSVGNFLASIAGVTGYTIFGLGAVQGFGNNACGRGFPYAPGAREHVPLSDPILFKGIGQRPGDVILSHHILKGLGAPF